MKLLSLVKYYLNAKLLIYESIDLQFINPWDEIQLSTDRVNANLLILISFEAITIFIKPRPRII